MDDYYATLPTTTLSLLTRSLPPDALTSLLATLSSLFNYLLVPSAHALPVSTWDLLKQSQMKFHAEIRRALAEGWRAALLRLKLAAVELSMSTPSEVEDFAAYTLVPACSGTSQALRNSTSFILTPAIKFHVKCGDEKSERLLRRVCTALAHHVKDAEGYKLEMHL